MKKTKPSIFAITQRDIKREMKRKVKGGMISNYQIILLTYVCVFFLTFFTVRLLNILITRD